jgi:alkyl hydroperoxide reductase subunit F
VPASGAVSGLVDLNKKDEIVVNSGCCASVSGVFAAGDVNDGPYKQLIIAAGDGAKAALSAYDYLMSKK